ncbi:Nuclear receptor 2C2-associated protein [Geodia barretti]|uniref:Nuclear receptor 2C2-associated protein n=1 Tax=Geodia barretti TaxID=519541 RepID=A0AA35U1J1_GEOBA|nr:Nuclear receptor 2C2-associated protein [Geodia barretti]
MATTTPLIQLEGEKKARVKVSSVLNRDLRQFGKQFMFDGSEETCWNSDQGSPQYVRVDLGRLAVVRELRVQFQGGFAGRECELKAGGGGGGEEDRVLMQFYPSDTNSLQIFPLNGDGEPTQVYSVFFKTSTDFFGRITVYSLQLYGSWVEE